METKLERIADKSRNEKRPIFTSLYHLINEELLKQCHKELDGSKAVGIDNVNKKEYAEEMCDENFKVPNIPEEIFAVRYIKDFNETMSNYKNVKKLKELATDGIAERGGG